MEFCLSEWRFGGQIKLGFWLNLLWGCLAGTDEMGIPAEIAVDWKNETDVLYFLTNFAVDHEPYGVQISTIFG